MARRIRIAVSVFFAVLSVALCVLWVRSDSYSDIVARESTKNRWVSSTLGVLRIAWDHRVSSGPTPAKWHFESGAIPAAAATKARWSCLSLPGVVQMPNYSYVRIPIWSIAVASVFITGSCWIASPRFSLRTLLIATTLVAGVLGLAVWAGR